MGEAPSEVKSVGQNQEKIWPPSGRPKMENQQTEPEKDGEIEGKKGHYLARLAINWMKSPTLASAFTSLVVNVALKAFSTATIKLTCIKESHPVTSLAVVASEI